MEDRVLELKDIACYLPYRLSVKDKLGYLRAVIFVQCEQSQSIGWEVITARGLDEHYNIISNCKPLLNPMSALTKPMIVEGYNDGKEFIPIIQMALLNWSRDYIKTRLSSHNEAEIYYLHINGYEDYRSYELPDDNRFSFSEIEFMAMCHIDFNDLIGQGLALDKTTI